MYIIIGSEYDGCNGWSSWNTDIICETEEKASEICREMNGRGYSRYNYEKLKMLK